MSICLIFVLFSFDVRTSASDCLESDVSEMSDISIMCVKWDVKLCLVTDRVCLLVTDGRDCA